MLPIAADFLCAENTFLGFSEFDEEQAINVISNTINNNDNAMMTNPAVFNFQPNFNPIDKMVELYERMIVLQKEMIDKLEQLMIK